MQGFYHAAYVIDYSCPMGNKINRIPSPLHKILLEANKLSGVVAHNLSGLQVILEVTDETDRVDAGDPEDAV
jgi:hypothetical protein